MGGIGTILGGGEGILGTLGTGMQMAGAANDLFGPKGALVTGDFGKGAGAMNTLGSGVQGFSDWYNKPNIPPAPTTQSTMGLSPEQFKQMPPEIGGKVLSRATQGGFRGGDVGEAFDLSPEQFNSIPPAIRQELLRKLGGR